MPPATAPPSSRAHRRAPDENAPAPPVIPFTSAAHEHTEPFLDVSVTPGAAATQVQVPDIPAYGFIRNIFLEITASGGTLGAGVLSADYPHNLIQSISLSDVNGAPIFGPIDGYAAMWTNIVGSYAFQPDPRRSPWYVSTINAAYPLRVPVEISHKDGFGALANQNAAASYKLNIVVNPSTTLYSTAPTTVPAFRIRGYLEAWSLPNITDVVGRRQAQFPPVHGTTQFWSHRTGVAVAAGANTVPLTRMGNLIRNIVVIARNNTAGSPRDDTVFPNPVTLDWDARNILTDTQNYRVQQMFERMNIQPTQRDAGVFAFNFNHQDHNQAGDDSPTLWLPTVQSTRMNLVGSVGTAGTLQILTNDIAPAETIPAERFVETSDTGFHPQIGVSNPAAL